jgi:predicted SAM-dependent methyltransferase
MKGSFINLACGSAYVDSPDWINFDFAASSPAVTQANLLQPLPVPSSSARLIYSSHFLEHVPRGDVDALLRECIRVLQPARWCTALGLAGSGGDDADLPETARDR